MTKDVVAAAVRRGDRYLVGLRPAEKRHGGLWEFPGGKLMPGESMYEAAIRELDEELRVRATNSGSILESILDEASELTIHFLEVTISGEPEAIEHQELRWGTVDELLELDLAPSDLRFVSDFGGSLTPENSSTRRQP